jgi:hypothetical protein
LFPAYDPADQQSEDRAIRVAGAMQLTAEDALRAFTDMINTLEIKGFLPLLTDDFQSV